MQTLATILAGMSPALLAYAILHAARYHTKAADKRAEEYWADLYVTCMVERDREFRRQHAIEQIGECYDGPY